MAKIPENVLNVLGECRADGNLLYLPSVQLDRKTYTEVNKVLENMGGKWNGPGTSHWWPAPIWSTCASGPERPLCSRCVRAAA